MHSNGWDWEVRATTRALVTSHTECAAKPLPEEPSTVVEDEDVVKVKHRVGTAGALGHRSYKYCVVVMQERARVQKPNNRDIIQVKGLRKVYPTEAQQPPKVRSIIDSGCSGSSIWPR